MPSTTFLAVARNNEVKTNVMAVLGILPMIWVGFNQNPPGYFGVERCDPVCVKPWFLFENESYWVCVIIASILFWKLLQALYPKTIVDRDVKLCQNCENEVSITTILNSNHWEILGVTESTRAVKSSNPVVGLTSTGGHVGVGVGTMQSTSHVPAKLGKVKFTVSCPSCGALFSWIENREVVQWTDPSGQNSFEIPGIVTLPSL